MATIDVTYGRAFKIWWSYIWRQVMLLVPVMIIGTILVFSISPFPTSGQSMPGPDQTPALVGKMGIVWLFLTALSTLMQVQAMRWMLKTKWRDFKLQLTSGE